MTPTPCVRDSLERWKGDFDGSAERVRLSKDGRLGKWVLTVKAACGDSSGFFASGCYGPDFKKVVAGAECYLYNQTN